MRALLLAALVLSPAVVSAQLVPPSALAEQLKARGVTVEPLMRPDRDRAVLRAKTTIGEARKLLLPLATQAEPSIGFLAKPPTLGEMRYRNELVLYKSEEDGSKTHIGYALEVAASAGKDARWTPVLLGRHGALRNRLFIGHDSLFATLAPELSQETLQAAGQKDLQRRRPLDTTGAWTARRQSRALGGLRPAKIAAPKTP